MDTRIPVAFINEAGDIVSETCLMDTGAFISQITERTRQHLQLPIIGYTAVQGYGAEIPRERMQHLPVVQIHEVVIADRSTFGRAVVNAVIGREHIAGLNILEPLHIGIDTVHGEIIKLRNPDKRTLRPRCPVCAGIIKNPQDGFGECSGCGVFIEVEPGG